MSYILAVVMNPADKGFEERSFTNWTLMTFALMPVTGAGASTCRFST